MIYDFNQTIDRTNDRSIKYDSLAERFGSADVLPFGIADMDLPTARPILDALTQRVEQGIFGYTARKESYFQAVANWQKRRNNWALDPANISHANGVVQAIAYFIKEHSKPNAEILVLSPGYTNFFRAIKGWGRTPLISKLLQTENGFQIDFEDLEEKIARKPDIFIMCSPHNPVGRVWTVQELTRIAKLTAENNILLLADEIHSDLILGDTPFVPMATLSPQLTKHIVTLVSTSKTFNLAGLQVANVIFQDKELQKQYDDYWHAYCLSGNDAFSQVAVEAAYNHGEDWLNQVLVHIKGNAEYVASYIKENIPQISTYVPEATYLMWLDCTELNMTPSELDQLFVDKAKIALNNGDNYGPGGEGFMRLNVACPRPMLEKAMEQLNSALK